MGQSFRGANHRSRVVIRRIVFAIRIWRIHFSSNFSFYAKFLLQNNLEFSDHWTALIIRCEPTEIRLALAAPEPGRIAPWAHEVGHGRRQSLANLLVRILLLLIGRVLGLWVHVTTSVRSVLFSFRFPCFDCMIFRSAQGGIVVTFTNFFLTYVLYVFAWLQKWTESAQ